LEIGNSRQALSKLDEDERGRVKIATSGGDSIPEAQKRAYSQLWCEEIPSD